MPVTSNNLSPTLCELRTSCQDDWARMTVSLDGEFGGGDLVRPVTSFVLGIQGRNKLAKSYGLSNWLSGVTSGALYAFRSLKLPRRIVQLHQLEGALQSSCMDALANGAAYAVAKLCDQSPPRLEFGEWRIECSIVAPSAPEKSSDRELTLAAYLREGVDLQVARERLQAIYNTLNDYSIAKFGKALTMSEFRQYILAGVPARVTA